MPRVSHDGAVELATYEDEGRYLSCLTWALGGLLFCVAFSTASIVSRTRSSALDAQTLQLRFRFGRSLLNDAQSMTVASIIGAIQDYSGLFWSRTSGRALLPQSWPSRAC